MQILQVNTLKTIFLIITVGMPSYTYDLSISILTYDSTQEIQIWIYPSNDNETNFAQQDSLESVNVVRDKKNQNQKGK